MTKLDIQKLNEIIKSGSEREVKTFLESKPEYKINILDEDGYGAIHYAMHSPNPVNMMKLLLEKGADINLRTPDDSTGKELIDIKKIFLIFYMYTYILCYSVTPSISDGKTRNKRLSPV